VLPGGVGVQAGLAGPDHRVEDLLRAGLQLAAPAAVAHPSFGAGEPDARVSRLARHDHAVRVPESDVVLFDRVVESAFPVGPGPLDLDGAAAFGVVGPLRRIEEVSAPVADDPAGIVLDPPEVEVDAVLRVGSVGAGRATFRSRAPGDRLRRRIAGLGGLAWEDHLDLLQLADAPVAHQLGHAMVTGIERSSVLV